jgi:hypothetical protein
VGIFLGAGTDSGKHWGIYVRKIWRKHSRRSAYEYQVAIVSAGIGWYDKIGRLFNVSPDSSYSAVGLIR